jgi:DNA-binding response OmpR family regulator
VKLILVVDDMASFREPIAASLRLAGYETISAADGEEALHLTRQRHPDLILLDLAMPKLDGLAFLNRLRDESAIAATPVILLSAMCDMSKVLAASELGVKDYLLKSRFQLKELLARVEKHLSPKTAEQTSADLSTNDPAATATRD